MRTFIRLVAIVVAASVALAVVAGVRWILPPPAPLIDAHREYNALVLRSIEGRDATDLYNNARVLFEPARHDLQAWSTRLNRQAELRLWWVAESLLAGSWDDPLHDEVKAFFAPHRAAIDAVVEAYSAGSQRVLVHEAILDSAPQDRPPLGRWIDYDSAEQSGLGSLGRVFLGVRLREYEVARDGEGFLSTVRTLLESRHRHPDRLSASRTNSGRLGLKATLWLIRDAALRGMDAQTSEALIAVINENTAVDTDAVLACIEGERLIMHDWVWRLRHTMDRYEFERAAVRHADDSLGDPAAVKRGGDKGVAAEIDRYFGAWSAVILSGDRHHPARPDLADYPRTAPWLARSHREIESGVDNHAFLPTEQAVTIAALRLAAYHDRHGRWPDTLEEAMPAMETREPLTGDPFGYAPPAEPGAGRTPRIEPPASIRPHVDTLLMRETPAERQRIFEVWRSYFINPRPSLTRENFWWLPEAGPHPN